jgi:hypothetical protein
VVFAQPQRFLTKLRINKPALSYSDEGPFWVDCRGLEKARDRRLLALSRLIRNARASAAIGGKADPDYTTSPNWIS